MQALSLAVHIPIVCFGIALTSAPQTHGTPQTIIATVTRSISISTFGQLPASAGSHADNAAGESRRGVEVLGARDDRSNPVREVTVDLGGRTAARLRLADMTKLARRPGLSFGKRIRSEPTPALCTVRRHC
jgi:hypothetical protein